MTVVDLASRRASIGGSEAASACGLDPYRARVRLWQEKRGEVENEGSEAAMWGTILEPVVFHYLEATGHNVMPAPADGFRDDKYEWLTGHPDGFAEIDGEAALLEIKTAGHWAAKDWYDAAGAPLPYLLQLQHYFYLTGYEQALLVALVGGQRLLKRAVYRDNAAIKTMLELEGDFMALLRSGEMPAPDGSRSSHEALLAEFAHIEAKPIRATKEIEREMREIRILDEGIKARKAQLEKRKQRVQAFMGEASDLISRHDVPLAAWRWRHDTRLDTSALKAARPEIYEEFAATKEVRRFTIE